jgi:hypothetical protein
MRRAISVLGGVLVFVAVFWWIANRRAQANTGGARERLIGTWELVSTEDRMSDGSKQPFQDFGPHAKGYLMYAADGHMSAQLMNPDRAKWKDEKKPTPEEKAKAFEGFAAYAGRFEVDEEKQIVYHLPDVALSADLLGTRQARPYFFDGDLLTFSGKMEGVPGVESYSITWRKVK